MPSGSNLIFAVKLFVAAMLSFALAARMGLGQPYWAVVTCCVCINPMSGAIRSKTIYRMMGTLCAGIASLTMAAMFGSAPTLLIIVAGLTASIGFGISFLDRTPRSYGFQLFAVTLMLVAVAGVDHPESMFTTAMTRVTEIAIGIMMITIVDAVISPGSMIGTLRSSLARWLPSMQRWAQDVFDGYEHDAKGEHDRLKLLVDISSLSQMTATLRFDPIIERRHLRYAIAIQERLLRMVPLLSAISDRIASLAPTERDALQPLLVEARACLSSGAILPAASVERIRDLPLATAELRPWHGLIHDALATMVQELLAVWREVQQLDAALEGREILDSGLERQIETVSAAPLPPDVDHALRLICGVVVSYAILCSLWLLTGWHQGPNAVLLGTVALAFFGGGDEAGKAIVMFGRYAVIALTLGAGLCYGLLPLATDFVTFAIAMGMFMLPLGVWAATNPMGILCLALALSNINLQDRYAPLDFGAYLDGCIGSLVGIYVAFVGAGLFRNWGSLPQLQRFMRIEQREIARITTARSRRDQLFYTQRALDRVVAMTSRLAATGQIERSARILARVRVGFNAADLKLVAADLDGDSRQAAEEVLVQLRGEFDASQPSTGLLVRIDTALTDLWTSQQTKTEAPAMRAMQALAGLRLALFEAAPAWKPVA